MSESPLVQSMIDRAKRWMKLLKRQSRSPSTVPDERRAAEMFSHAQDLTINGGQFINQFINEMKINYINDVVSNRQAVFELLKPYTCLGATKDSSARYPPPRCHPQTRLKVRERLTQWLSNEHEEQRMLWVRGFAGTGKSAVAQSFGDSCEEGENFGASYFFSRAANRNKLETVVPTLAYQLANSIPEYRSFIGHRLAEHPLLLENSPPVQFRKLIAEPFMALQRHSSQKPIAIILDGLDECEGEDAQLQIIEMVTNAIRSYPDLRLRWLIFSRPEAHLKNEFSRNLLCGREELIIDAECWENVERYVQDRLSEIKNAYKDVVPVEWPSQNKHAELLDAVSGLFVLASTCLNFIADPEAADPPSRLNYLLTFMRHSQGVASRNPLQSLDLLYFKILEKIPSTVFETTRKILGYLCHRNKLDEEKRLDSAQLLSNFFLLDQHSFYKAVRGLHSVMSISEPEDAAKSQLQFYHASFHDFLLKPNRSGMFTISEQGALSDVIEFCVYWCEVDATRFHTHDGWDFNYNHKNHDVLDLTWVSEYNRSSTSESIMDFVENGILDPDFDMELEIVNDGLLSRLFDINFRYWRRRHVFRLAEVCRLDPSTSVVRVEPSNPTDHHLLDHFKVVIGNGIAKPAKLPLSRHFSDGKWIREYFFIGHGVKSVIVWVTKAPWSSNRIYSLRCDENPSKGQVSEYAEYLNTIRWDETKATLRMK